MKKKNGLLYEKNHHNSIHGYSEYKLWIYLSLPACSSKQSLYPLSKALIKHLWHAGWSESSMDTKTMRQALLSVNQNVIKHENNHLGVSCKRDSDSNANHQATKLAASWSISPHGKQSFKSACASALWLTVQGDSGPALKIEPLETLFPALNRYTKYAC